MIIQNFRKARVLKCFRRQLPWSIELAIDTQKNRARLFICLVEKRFLFVLFGRVQVPWL